MDAVPWRLGAVGPVQQSPVTCGSASLTVARMMVDPAFARWIVTGRPGTGAATDSRTEQSRFADYERTVMSRTNALVGAGGRLQLPWPRALGTPPWGALGELETGAATPGARYRLRVVRFAGPAALRGTYRHLVGVVDDGRPALLYVGDALTPRHVTLVLPAAGAGVLDVYDPASGAVTPLDEDRYAACRLGLAGWPMPWVLVQPDGRDAAAAG